MTRPSHSTLGFCTPCGVPARACDGRCPLCFELRLLDLDAEPLPRPGAIPADCAAIASGDVVSEYGVEGAAP